MNKIVTRGFGPTATRQGIVTQGHGGLLSAVIQALAQAGRNVVVRGKRYADRVKEEFDNVVVKVTLLTINNNIMDMVGQEKGEVKKGMTNPRVYLSLVRKRIVDAIRLSAKRIK